MSIAPYRRILSVPEARRVLVIGFFLRIPIFGTGVLLTLHVVEGLGGSWKEAGLVAAAATLAIAISGPWRGRLLDRLGLRRVVLPSLVITAVTWSIAPFVGYWPLLVLAAGAGLFVVPVFSVLRQAVMAVADEDDRRTALSLDGVALELSYMSGPALGVVLAAHWGTAWTLVAMQAAAVLGGIALWLMNPPLRAARPNVTESDAPAVRGLRSWLRPRFVVLCAAAAATTIVLVGSEVAVVSALRDWGQQGSLGIVFAGWGIGSIVGGLVYGGLSRSISPYLLLAGLAVVTLPMALASSAWSVAGLALFAGLFCAPTITATIDAVSRTVPTSALGEAMGWHGACMTVGSALASPIAGVAIDHGGYEPAVVLVSLIGLAVALAGGLAVLHARRRARPALVA